MDPSTNHRRHLRFGTVVVATCTVAIFVIGAQPQAAGRSTGRRTEVASAEVGAHVPNTAVVVSNLAKLRALAVRQGHPNVATVLAHTTTGDGGGGVFLWDPANNQPDDSGLTVAPAGRQSRGRWIRQTDHTELRAVWWGVSPQREDNLDALQAAANYCEALHKNMPLVFRGNSFQGEDHLVFYDGLLAGRSVQHANVHFQRESDGGGVGWGLPVTCFRVSGHVNM